jgi:putative membrane protein
MMWYWGYGQGWPWVGGLMMLAFGVGFFILAAWIFRTYARPHQPADSALDTLKQRLASGQITPEEFEQTKKVLQS